MRFSIKLPGVTLYPGIGKHWWEHITPDEMIACARAAEDLGFDNIHIPDHIIMHRSAVNEMGTRWSHSLSAAGFVLGATSRIDVACLVIVPCHNPIEQAKAIATLDYMSGGRLIVVPMVGYQQWEFELLRTPPFEERGAVMDEYMDAMIELWTSDDPRFDGKYVSFSDVIFDPKPVQKPYPQLHFGGRTRAALRRIARLGDGWLSYATPRPKFRDEVEYIRSQPEFQARPRPLELGLGLFEGYREPLTHKVVHQPDIVFDKDAILEQVAEISELGATITAADDLVGIGKYQNDRPDAPPKTRNVTEYLERMQWFAEEIMPEARKIGPPPLAPVG